MATCSEDSAAINAIIDGVTEDTIDGLAKSLVNPSNYGRPEVRENLLRSFESLKNIFQDGKSSLPQFEKEFKLIDAAAFPERFAPIAHDNVNASKNRYKNIVPYQHNRVQLNTPNSIDHSDYINASFLKLNCVNPALDTNVDLQIVTPQRPLENTIHDFWSMIIDYHIKFMVAIGSDCNADKGLVDVTKGIYWPEIVGQTLTTDRFNILLKSDKTLWSIMNVRALVVSDKVTNKPIRTIVQLHFSVWQDLDVPGSTIYMLRYLALVRHLMKKFNVGKSCTGWRVSPLTMSAPLLIHCSASVGRTGLTVALLYIIEKLEAGLKLVSNATQPDEFSFLETALKLRNERMHMVELQKQYVTGHEVLIDALKFSLQKI